MSTIGEYSAKEIAEMDSDAFNAAKQRGFKRAEDTVTASDVANAYAAARELPEHLTGRPAAAGTALPTSAPVAFPQPATASRTAWADRKAKQGKDFTTPSGQICKLRPLQPEELLAEGILDQVTRLEGLAADLVDRAEGNPPNKQTMPSREEFQQLLDLVNVVVPLAVAEPVIYPDSATVEGDVIRVSDIDLIDRVAILNEALSGLKAFDNFRPAG